MEQYLINLIIMLTCMEIGYIIYIIIEDATEGQLLDLKGQAAFATLIYYAITAFITAIIGVGKAIDGKDPLFSVLHFKVIIGLPIIALVLALIIYVNKLMGKLVILINDKLRGNIK